METKTLEKNLGLKGIATPEIYLDNAATTALSREVRDAMDLYETKYYANPSSAHRLGRAANTVVENARNIVAQYLNVSPKEIVFTGSGSEGSNMVIKCAVRDLKVRRIISSPIEHDCVLNAVKAMGEYGIEVNYVKVDSQGRVDYDELSALLKPTATDEKTLVSLMHANNEIGTLLDLKRVSDLCKSVGAYFHTDAVQTVGYFPFNLNEIKIDFLNSAAHKFHGPKGVGFVYINQDAQIKALIHGGSQERNLRGGTHNVAGIVGMGAALDIARVNMIENKNIIAGLKQYMKGRLIEEIPGIEFNGDTSDYGSSYKVLSVLLPADSKYENALFELDIAGIAASSGSACSSECARSHVLEAINSDPKRKTIRFSFSKYNTKEHVDYAIKVLTGIRAN